MIPPILRNRRVLLLLGTVALLLTVALWPKRQAVDLVSVVRTDIVVTVEDEGETRIRYPFVVSAPVSGRVLRIDLEPGDEVVAHKTVLATFRPGAPEPLDSRTRAEALQAAQAARAAVGRVQAERERSEAAAVLARSDVDRARSLSAQGITSREELDSAEAAARSADQALQAATFALDVARAELGMTKARLVAARDAAATKGETLPLTSPIDGVVLRRHRQSEAVVRAGDPLLDVGDPSGLEIVADLISSDAVRVRPGALVFIEQWGGESLTARVRRVEPAGFMKISALGVEEQRVNVIMDFADPLEAWKALGDGYRVEVRIVVAEAKAVVAVPVSSLFRHGAEWHLFVAERGRARLRKVALGHRNNNLAQIREGVAEGETVIDHPTDTLAEGSRIRSRE